MKIRAIVGGVDYTVGGLGKYEIRRRAIRYKYSKKYSGGIIKEDERHKAYYKDKKHINSRMMLLNLFYQFVGKIVLFIKLQYN
jgi:hypothetical protein